MDKLFIEDLPIKSKKILMRVDFNVPLDAAGNVLDASRIQAALASIRYVLDQGGSLILMSHLGRPKNATNKNLSLAPCAKILSSILETNVKMANDCVGFEVEQLIQNIKPQEVILLENLRFHRAEEHPEEDLEFSKKLASYGDFYINDAFGTAHRKHSSTYFVPTYFPGKAAAGYLMEKEMSFLSQAMHHPKRPFVALIGGAKVSTKMGVLKSLIQKVDTLMIGGGMSYTFLNAQGINIGNSLCEKDLVSVAKEILKEAEEKKVKVLLPLDAVIAKQLSSDEKTKVVDLSKGIPEDMQGFDIGPQTISLFKKHLSEAKTILWNGPVGVYEMNDFAQGSLQIALAIAQTSALKIVGGGDSIAVLNLAEVASQITHISTGGGATLEFIEQGSLPGIEVLSPKN